MISKLYYALGTVHKLGNANYGIFVIAILKCRQSKSTSTRYTLELEVLWLVTPVYPATNEYYIMIH